MRRTRSDSSQDKARGDAVLKTLPDALQERIWQFLRKNTQAKTLAWLQEEHGIALKSGKTLTDFFQWYPRSCMLRTAASVSDQLESTLKKMPEMREAAKNASKVAQVNFEIMAAQDRDPVLFAALRKGELENERLRLEREKFEWSKKTDIEKGLTALHAEIEGDEEAERLYDAFAAHVRAKKKGGKK
jgi:hypothetical protein